MKTAIDNNGIEIQVSDDTPVNTTSGIHYLLTPEEETQEQIKKTEWESKSIRRSGLAEISRLEGLQTPRRIREAILNNDNGWLAALELLIEAERDKL